MRPLFSEALAGYLKWICIPKDAPNKPLQLSSDVVFPSMHLSMSLRTVQLPLPPRQAQSFSLSQKSISEYGDTLDGGDNKVFTRSKCDEANSRYASLSKSSLSPL